MREHYVATYMGDKFCAAYRRGTLIVLRLADSHVVALDLRETNQFRRAASVDMAAQLFEKAMRKSKAVSYAAGVITIHTQHLAKRVET